MTAYQATAQLGRYELLGKLATGGMGEIHLARLAGDGGFEKLLVVKRLLPELVASEQFVAMFLDEARIAARLSHPNVCEVFDLGRDGADYYLAMPYLEGVSFADLIARPRDDDPEARRLDLRRIAGLVQQAAEGLHHAHELRDRDGAPLGLVHRDVSPSNLMVTRAGVVKVLDFGIAKVRGASARTEAGTIKGKYAYMSPEQVRGDELDRRSDVFSLGIVLWELVTRRRLFQRASDYLAAKAILEEPIPRADDVPDALADAIARALEREPSARFATARDLGAAVAGAVADLGGPLDAAALADAVVTGHADELSAQATRKQQVLATTVALRRPRPSPPRRGAALALAAGVVVAAAAALLLASRSCTSTVPGTVDPPPLSTVPGTVERPVAVNSAETDASMSTVPGTVDATPMSTVPGTVDAAPAPRADRRPGYLSIDSQPYATIYVDGKKVGETPLLKLALPPGKRRIRAVRADGQEKRLTVEIRPGKLARPVNLRW